MFDLFKTFALSRAFTEDEAGATAIEYDLIAALSAIGTSLISLFEFINSTLQGALS